MNEKLDSYLKDLTKLTKKYNMKIVGYDICIEQDVGSQRLYHEDLNYKDGKYIVEEDTFERLENK